MQTDPVVQYYDHNTRRFLRLGGSGEAAAIHRSIWAPGVTNRRQAFEYLNQTVGASLQPALGLQNPPRLLDLGCGVGGTATWLAERLDAHITGVTLSPVQRDIAEQRAKRLGVAERCRFITANFLDLPRTDPICGAYAIEAFAHTTAPQRFFVQAAAQLLPQGRLVICDDFLDGGATALSPNHAAWKTIRGFTSGWRLGTLLTVERVRQYAAEAGMRLVSNDDLTPYLKTIHPLLLLPLYWLTRLRMPGAYWQNLAGGSALQICLRSGWTRYHQLVFEKEGLCTPSP